MTTPIHNLPLNQNAWPPALKKAAAWILGAALLRLLLATLVPLFPDETYYWTWTTHLQTGYFDHPPGIALLIALGTTFFGDTTAGVRAGPAIAALITHSATTTVAWQLGGRGVRGAEAALRTAILFTVIPLATLGMVLATPDAALFAMATVAMVAVDRALSAPTGTRTSFIWWTVAGGFLGAAFVAKYTAVLLPAALVIACLVHPALRVRFREAGPWWAGGIALALFSPVVMWNAANDWISFRFQLDHGFGTTPRGSVLTRELDMMGAQFGLATPILYVFGALVMLAALREGWRRRHTLGPTDIATRRFAFAVIGFLPVVFFAVSATRRPVEANWPAMSYPSVILLIATDPRWLHADRLRESSFYRWWKRGVVLAAALLAIAVIQVWRPILPLEPKYDPIARAYGFTTLAAAVSRAQRDDFLRGAPHVFVTANRYQDASELWFHLPEQPAVLSLNVEGRPNQYDLWPMAHERLRPGDALVAVFDDTPRGDSLGVRVAEWFAETQRGPHVTLKRGTGAVANRRIWMYRNAHRLISRITTLSTTP